MSIAELLRTSSLPKHQQAEASGFIVDLMRGKLDLSAYAKYLTNLAWLYETLEAKILEGEPARNSEQLWDSRLNRLSSIDADLESLGVANWRETTKPSPAMASYIEHINSLSGKDDFRLIAHHYTRYLGDLSGGQAIAALVARNYGATPDQLSFYRFEQISNLVRFKEDYRSALDGLQISDVDLDALVQEVQLAFSFNQRVFEDLADGTTK